MCQVIFIYSGSPEPPLLPGEQIEVLSRPQNCHKYSGRNCWAVGSSPWAGPDRLFIEARPMGPPSHINSVRVRLMRRTPGIADLGDA
jgi:hypothetical protein